MTDHEFKATPLYRLTATYEEDLKRINNPELEVVLADQLRERLEEATVKRDASFKSLLLIDVILAIAVSGRNFDIPGFGISTKDLPAVMEILVGIASFGICLTAVSFTTWLCYSQILWMVTRRSGQKSDMQCGILTDSNHFNEMAVRLFQRQIAFDKELFIPLAQFKALAFIFTWATNILFSLIPIIHVMLVGYGLVLIYQRSGFSPLHTLLYIAVAIGHLLALIVWFAPSREFKFLLRNR